MKHLLFILILTLSVTFAEDTSQEKQDKFRMHSTDYSMWLELNFSATNYSVLLDSIDVTKVSSEDPAYMIAYEWIPYNVTAEVIDVYKGEFKKGAELDLLVYVWPIIGKKLQEKLIHNRFLLSFCESSNGVYYTSQNFLIAQPTVGNIAKMRDIRKFGTLHDSSHECSSNFPELNPDNHW